MARPTVHLREVQKLALLLALLLLGSLLAD